MDLEMDLFPIIFPFVSIVPNDTRMPFFATLFTYVLELAISSTFVGVITCTIIIVTIMVTIDDSFGLNKIYFNLNCALI